tara:strand:+ start:311 stop:646 length:336 start_codon:yes stop_codon:yes gene_type:complete
MKTLLISLVLAATSPMSDDRHGDEVYHGQITLTNVERESPRVYKWNNYRFETFDDCPYSQSTIRAYILLEDDNTPSESVECGKGFCWFLFGDNQRCDVSFYEARGPKCGDR